MNAAELSPTRYGDWAKDRQGWFLGLTGPGLVIVVGSGLPALLAAGSRKWLLALAWLPVWGLITFAVAVPVKGRSLAAWTTDSTYRAVGAVMGWNRWQSKASTGVATDLAEADLPGVLAGIRTHDGPPFGPHLKRPVLVQNHANETWAVVARITHPGIGLAEVGARNRMASGLSELLEGTATADRVSVIAFQVRTVPDDGAERADWQLRHRRDSAPALAKQVNDELDMAMLQTGVRHELFVTVVVPEARIAADAKEAGGGVDGRARVIYGVMQEIGQRLLGPVRCDSVDWLDSAELAAAIRTGFAPSDRAGLIEAGLAGRNDPRVASALPMAAAGPSRAPTPERRHYVHDAWSTVSCTVLLPDQGAIMGALAPVFTPGSAGERRCVTVFFEPIPRARGDRMVAKEQMSAGSAEYLQAKAGFAKRASHRRDQNRVEQQDQRLAAGRVLVRASVAAAVTVPSTWPIADYGRRLEAAIRGSGFTPLRLDLAQDSGFAAACVPLGVGLSTKRVGR